MRIEDLSSQPLKGHSVGRSSDARSGASRAARTGAPGSDLVALSGFAQLAGGAPPERVEQLRNEVADRAYRVPAEQVSRAIVEYYLGS